MDSQTKARRAAHWAGELKTDDLKILDVQGICNYTDYMVLCTGNSRPHLQAIGDSVVNGLKNEGCLPSAIDGRGLETWIVLDFGDVVIHIMNEETRAFYSLESLWGDAKEVSLSARQTRVRQTIA